VTASESEKKQNGPKTERTKKQTERSQNHFKNLSFSPSHKFFLLFRLCSASVPPLFLLFSSSFLFYFVFNLFHSFSFCSNNAEIFRLKRPCFLMMDMNAFS